MPASVSPLADPAAGVFALWYDTDVRRRPSRHAQGAGEDTRRRMGWEATDERPGARSPEPASFSQPAGRFLQHQRADGTTTGRRNERIDSRKGGSGWGEGARAPAWSDSLSSPATRVELPLLTQSLDHRPIFHPLAADSSIVPSRGRPPPIRLFVVRRPPSSPGAFLPACPQRSLARRHV